MPHETAIRETFEETGVVIDIETFGMEGGTFPSPLYVERYINKVGDMVDFQYVGKVINNEISNKENNEVGFFSLEELKEMQVDKEIINKTKKLIKNINSK